LKTARLGYDGKGQVRIDAGADLDRAWSRMGGEAAVLEAFVELDKEISVIVARGMDGAVAAYPAVENVHLDHILHTTTAPADISPDLARKAEDMAIRIARALELTGLLAVEMFIPKSGGPRSGDLMVNEIAPRPHNSGHWTLDACACGQFEQLVRAVCGLPLGSTARHSDAVMTNLIGGDIDTWPALAAEPGACLHLYGKAQTRPGRKMGHVTRLIPKPA
jgi:5-(carboxyamino)imidazole ribonucleotide synthase